MADDPTDTNKDPRPPHSSQLSMSLPGTTVYITGHEPKSNKAHVAQTRTTTWKAYDDKQIAMSPCYTNTFKADLNDDADLTAHDTLMDSGSLGLVKPGGTVCRQVDMAPGYTCTMHRTSSLDYGVVLEGAVEMLLDDGSATLLRRGDVAVQRATMHAWRNASQTEWARMLFVLQDIAPLTVGDKVVSEEMESRPAELAESGN